MRLLLDEHISYKIAEQLRAGGYDAIAVTEVQELRALPDHAVFEWAVARGRAVVTHDTDFATLLHERLAAEALVADVILVPKRTFPRGDRGQGALLRALVALMDAPVRETARGRLIWL